MVCLLRSLVALCDLSMLSPNTKEDIIALAQSRRQRSCTHTHIHFVLLSWLHPCVFACGCMCVRAGNLAYFAAPTRPPHINTDMHAHTHTQSHENMLILMHVSVCSKTSPHPSASIERLTNSTTQALTHLHMHARMEVL